MIAGTLLALVAVVNVELAQAGARIEFENREHHFGRVVQGKVVEYQFQFTNVGDEDLIINEVSTPCGCTAVLPDKRVIPPGGSSHLEVSYDSAARGGEVTRVITVLSNDSEEPELLLTVVAQVDASMHAAFQAGEALFGPKCGSCHVEPTRGKSGRELFEAACWFCHGTQREGKTALALPAYPEDMTPFLKHVIGHGVPGTEMPGFADEAGGPLDPAQIESLVKFMYTEPPPPPEHEPEPEEAPAIGDPAQPFFN